MLVQKSGLELLLAQTMVVARAVGEMVRLWMYFDARANRMS